MLSSDDEDVIVSGVIYAEEWLAVDNRCPCLQCEITRSLCETITSIVYSVPERLDS